MDLAETHPYNDTVHSLTSGESFLKTVQTIFILFLRQRYTVEKPFLHQYQGCFCGLKACNRFRENLCAQTWAKQFYFNPQVGFLSLNQQLQPDDVLAVAYQYTL